MHGTIVITTSDLWPRGHTFDTWPFHFM